MQQITTHIKRLSRFERPKIARHFLALAAEDRRLRFGAGQSDQAVRIYVNAVDFERDALFGVLNDQLRFIGVAHLARSDGHAELGISVAGRNRGRGIGGALLKRAHTHARNWGMERLFMHCLTENGAMMHLARKEGMDVVAEAGEADAWLRLPPADASSYASAAFEQCIAHVDHAAKFQRAGLRRLVHSLSA
ncbi:MAG: GNAT family N-acetyltransferase [Betaproteobacteria bacterium]